MKKKRGGTVIAAHTSALLAPAEGRAPLEAQREDALFRDAGALVGGVPTSAERLAQLRELSDAVVRSGRAARLYVVFDTITPHAEPLMELFATISQHWADSLPRPRILPAHPPRRGVPAWVPRLTAVEAAMVDIREVALAREVISIDPGWTLAPPRQRVLARKLNAACGVRFVPYASSWLGLTRGDTLTLSRLLGLTPAVEEWPASGDEPL